MKKQLSDYFRDVEEIQVLDDILTSYSHAKVNRIYKYENIRILFEFFMTHNKDHFLDSLEGEKRDRYDDALRELIENFKTG